jgi:hypothetical protein
MEKHQMFLIGMDYHSFLIYFSNLFNSEEYEDLGPIANLQDWYLVRHKPTHEHNTRTRSFPVVPNKEITDVLMSHPDVSLCQQVGPIYLYHYTILTSIFSKGQSLLHTKLFSLKIHFIHLNGILTTLDNLEPLLGLM